MGLNIFEFEFEFLLIYSNSKCKNRLPRVMSKKNVLMNSKTSVKGDFFLPYEPTPQGYEQEKFAHEKENICLQIKK